MTDHNAHETAGVGFSARIRSVVSESMIYGVLLVSALIIVTGQKSDTSWDTFVAVGVTIVVFWIAHVFAAVVSNLGRETGRELPLGTIVLNGMRHTSGLLWGALIPLFVILLGAAGVLTDEVAVWTALWIDAVLLGLIGYVTLARVTPKRWARALGAAATMALGVAIMALKAFIH
jgi:hypothetical protein